MCLVFCLFVNGAFLRLWQSGRWKGPQNPPYQCPGFWSPCVFEGVQVNFDFVGQGVDLDIKVLLGAAVLARTGAFHAD